MDLNKMTREDFEKVPHREWNKDIGAFDCLVIMPLQIKWYQVLKYNVIQLLKEKFNWFDSYYLPNGLHDSGFRCMDFIACNQEEPICRLSGCSDVIHLDGIGGYGKDWLKKYGNIPEKIPTRDWNIDCLRESGFLRIFSSGSNLEAGNALSSFELYAVERQKKTNSV